MSVQSACHKKSSSEKAESKNVDEDSKPVTHKKTGASSKDISNGFKHNSSNNARENGSNESKEENPLTQLNEGQGNASVECDDLYVPENTILKNEAAVNGNKLDDDGGGHGKTNHLKLLDESSKKNQKSKHDIQKTSSPLLPTNKVRIESAKKPESTFIKVDYLKPTTTERTKESVSRVLDFAAGEVDKGKETLHRTAIKKEAGTDIIPQLTNNKAQCTVQPSISSDIKQEAEPKPDIKKEAGSSSKHSKSSSQHSSHHKSHSSSHHKSSSSSHRSRHSSSKECSRCYRRSKIKKANIGVQVRPNEDEKPKPPTRPLEFEASHRVGVNRRPVVIDTNLSYLKYGRFYHIEVHPNGGASIVHMYQDELDTLSSQQMTELVDEFFELTFSEDENGFAYHVMGVVHDGARYLPDLLEHMAENYSNLTVKSGVLGRNNDIETCTMLQYYDQVLKTYDEGTVRHGPLHQISLVGKVHEEVGGYFPDLLGKLEQSPFLKKAMPWGKLSIVQMDPRLSNDGPILWIRPGEQLIPTADLAKTPLKRQRRINELRNLQYLPRVSEARETMFEDRTRAHADHVGMGHERQTTAAVGKLRLFQDQRVEFLSLF